MAQLQLVISADKIGGSVEENNLMNTITHLGEFMTRFFLSKSVVGDQSSWKVYMACICTPIPQY